MFLTISVSFYLFTNLPHIFYIYILYILTSNHIYIIYIIIHIYLGNSCYCNSEAIQIHIQHAAFVHPDLKANYNFYAFGDFKKEGRKKLKNSPCSSVFFNTHFIIIKFTRKSSSRKYKDF